jgi:hypothetical protein
VCVGQKKLLRYESATHRIEGAALGIAKLLDARVGLVEPLPQLRGLCARCVEVSLADELLHAEELPAGVTDCGRTAVATVTPEALNLKLEAALLALEGADALPERLACLVELSLRLLELGARALLALSEKAPLALEVRNARLEVPALCT